MYVNIPLKLVRTRTLIVSVYLMHKIAPPSPGTLRSWVQPTFCCTCEGKTENRASLMPLIFKIFGASLGAQLIHEWKSFCSASMYRLRANCQYHASMDILDLNWLPALQWSTYAFNAIPRNSFACVTSVNTCIDCNLWIISQPPFSPVPWPCCPPLPLIHPGVLCLLHPLPHLHVLLIEGFGERQTAQRAVLLRLQHTSCYRKHVTWPSQRSRNGKHQIRNKIHEPGFAALLRLGAIC